MFRPVKDHARLACRIMSISFIFSHLLDMFLKLRNDASNGIANRYLCQLGKCKRHYRLGFDYLFPSSSEKWLWNLLSALLNLILLPKYEAPKADCKGWYINIMKFALTKLERISLQEIRENVIVFFLFDSLLAGQTQLWVLLQTVLTNIKLPNSKNKVVYLR